MAIQNRQGSVPPAVIEGHEPRRSDEIALGSISLSSLNRQVGDTVTVAANHKPTQRLRVVGRAVLNQPGYDLTGAIAPGKGGLVRPDLLRRLAPDPAFAYPGALLVRIHPAVDREQALARLQRDFPGMISTPRPHADIRNLQRIAHLPALLAGLVALVGLMLALAMVKPFRGRGLIMPILIVPLFISPVIVGQAVLQHLANQAGRESEFYDDVIASRLIGRDGDAHRVGGEGDGLLEDVDGEGARKPRAIDANTFF